MKGKLTEQPVAELIREISSKGFSGTLRLKRERMQAAVYFEQGQIVFAAANLRTLRLREYLANRGLLPTHELAGLGADLSDLALAALLVDSKRVSRKDLNTLLQGLVTDVLRVALFLTEGSWEFNERARLDDPAQVTIDIPNLLLEAARRMPLQFVAGRLRNPNEKISRTAEVSRESNLQPAESFLLSRLDQPTKLAELITLSGLRELDAYRVIYGLALAGLVMREHWQNAFRTDAARQTETARPVVTEPAAVPGTPNDNRWTSVSAEEETLETFLRRIKQATNYYDVFELPTTTQSNEIKEAYYALARVYHPDRFHLRSGTALHTELSSAFARITQGYETLTDPNARAAYDQSLERSRLFSESAPKPETADSLPDAEVDFDTDAPENESNRAEYNFREGVGALQQGRVAAAMTHLAAAARAAPQEARYRAHYGRALAANEQTRRLAENELQAAVKIEPGSAAFRVMLAELYFELKFHRRAKTEVERALTLDANNQNAHALLRKLEKSRKVG
jgi:curved DNA-binding protein CbpA